MLNYNRAIEICDEIINELNLDLKGISVLTETGSQIFSITPFIAARASADKVYAWTSDSKFGKGSNNILLTKKFLSKTGINNIVEFSLNKRQIAHVRKADLITNLGFVRPINKEFIDNLRSGCVVTTMSESWEVRYSDIDIKYCAIKGVKVGGTWENYPGLMIFDSVGNLALKLAMEAGFEIYKNRILIWSSDNFGKTIQKAFLNAGAASVQLIHSNNSLNKALIKGKCDFIFIADYKGSSKIIGDNGLLDIKTILCKNIIHLCGEVDINYGKRFDLKIYPQENGLKHRMSKTLAYLGYRPLIELHTAGFKVGEFLLKKKKSKLIQEIV